MKRIYRTLKLQKISKLFYTRGAHSVISLKDQEINIDKFKIRRDDKKNNIVFTLLIDDEIVHTSIVYKKVHLSKKLGKPLIGIIGSCFTKDNYRGMGIYPYMLDYISWTLLKENDEIGILVSPDNTASIRGIEKAGFKQILHILTYRFLMLYFFTQKRFTNIG